MSGFSSKINNFSTNRLRYLIVALLFIIITVLFNLNFRIVNANLSYFEYSFDDTSIEEILTVDFTESPEDDSYTYSADDGMYESGAINTEEKDSIWTTKRAFSLPQEGDSYRIVGFFRNYAGSGFGSMGFTTEAINSLVEDSNPIPETGLGVSFHGGGGSFINNTSADDFLYDEGDISDSWHRVIFEIEALEEDQYNLYFHIEETDQYDDDSDSKSYNEVNQISNVTFSGADEVYGYFATSGTRFDRVDEIEIEARSLPRTLPPVPTSIRTHVNNQTGDVFLGGDYIEVGINKLGSFGTSQNQDVPSNFFGTNVRDNIGMSTNPTGFGVGPDLRMDFFLPGSPEERWSIGYKQGDDTTTASNAALSGSSDISNNIVTNLSGGNTLRARSVGTYDNSLETTQTISFHRTQKFFKNEVTLKNVGNASKQSVRYLRSFDPDNTVDQDGDYDTRNFIPYTHEAGDGKAVVVADTSLNDSDPVYQINGSRSPILFYSADERARVSTFGFSNSDPYDDDAYDGALSKGTSVDGDQAITIAFDVGALAPGQSQTFIYYTSLDNRDIEDVLDEIENAAGQDNASEDRNGDGIPDSEQPNVTSYVSTLTGKVVVLEVDENCSIESALIKGELENIVQDAGYDYPNGLLDFTVNCGTPGYTTNVRQLYYEVLPEGFKARKYNPGASAYFDIPGANIGLTSLNGYNVTTLTYQVTDGGELDLDGEVNGIIVDPAGLGVRGIGVPNTGLGGNTFYLGKLTLNY